MRAREASDQFSLPVVRSLHSGVTFEILLNRVSLIVQTVACHVERSETSLITVAEERPNRGS
jgi:hypothetical protein